MHLYFVSRGIKHERDLFVSTLQSQQFDWVRYNLKTKKNETVRVQGQLRPVELWEYVFPEPHLQEVLTMLHMNNKKEGNYGLSVASMMAIRKMIGCKKIPIMQDIETKRWIHTRGIALHTIGVRYDDIEDMDFGEGGKYSQERL